MSFTEAELEMIGRMAREAALELAVLSSTRKNAILHAIADGIEEFAPQILAENAKDLANAEAAGLSDAMIDRLRLDQSRISKMAIGIREVAMLPDPVGEVLAEWERPNGLRLQKVRTPIGVIAIIYESRPNVTSDASVLCLKSGNAVILRGGSEAFHSNCAIVVAMQKAGKRAGLPAGAIQALPTTDREAVSVLCKAERYVDLIIPRGGKQLIERVVSEARMPVIKHYEGICHVYVDKAADLEMAIRIVVNAKCQRPGVCNAMETLLVHKEIAAEFLPRCAEELQSRGVELRCCPESLPLCGPKAIPATEADWSTEYLALILSVRVVPSLEEAINHINRYGSKHTDSIVTADEKAAEVFLARVDSATVLWNASTRFSDGGEFGFGAEIGISTDKIHARGPMALPELTSYKYLVRGNGQIRT
ncbi:MAG: glutamate-5-semialdehyde dehydrogenase [Chthoniobacterales bacterium]|nr:glutamate-5-semialdehyde dehydrogenase [Chthoniobacterales bacterium]MCX7712755.1 glutamate-5-semialdehyde dehydrogenase [Chthoniobacterales bacterium]